MPLLSVTTALTAGAVALLSYFGNNALQERINQTLNGLQSKGKLIERSIQDVNILNIEIGEKWKNYELEYDEYYSIAQQQLDYSIENNDDTMHQLVLIGVTGSGKSLFGNRLSGYQGDDDANGYFVVSDDLDSVTRNISKLIVYNLHSINISILDTPGIFDSLNNDIVHQHNLIEYLKGSNGVNAFLLVLKKDRLSQNIQQMLKAFHRAFGDEFWSHLIFVINFWNERETKNWNEWSNGFVNRIRRDFDLKDRVKYPLNIVGLNNFGSYRLQIKRDLIPNIPSNRLKSDAFISPLDSLEYGLSKEYDGITNILKKRDELATAISKICDKFWNEFNSNLMKLHLWIEKTTFCELCEHPYLNFIYKVEFAVNLTFEECENRGFKFLSQYIVDWYSTKCTRFKYYPKINDILEELEQKKVSLDKRNKVALPHHDIDYAETNNLLYKYSYLMEGKGQYLLNCLNKSKKFMRKKELFNSLNQILDEYPEQLIKSELVCNDKCNDIISYCKQNENQQMLLDDGARFEFR